MILRKPTFYWRSTIYGESFQRILIILVPRVPRWRLGKLESMTAMVLGIGINIHKHGQWNTLPFAGDGAMGHNVGEMVHIRRFHRCKYLPRSIYGVTCATGADRHEIISTQISLLS